MAGVAAVTSTGIQGPDRTGQPELAPNPQLAGGFSFEDVDIAGVTVLDEDSYRGGVTALYEYEMTNGNLYQVRSNRPNDLASDTGVFSTTPWITRAGGFNSDNMSGLNALGYQTEFVEPHGSAIRASLPLSAHNLELISADRLGKSDLRPDTKLYFGASRAAAIGSGVISAYSDLLAPCYPTAGTWQQLPKDALQLALEGLETGRHIGTLGLKKAIGQRATVSAHPSDMFHTVLTIPHLRNGDAGKMLWANSDVPMHITLFDKDGWSRPDEIIDMADDRPNLHIAVLSGRHLALARQAVIQASFDRFGAVAEMRGFDGSFEDVDFDRVWQIQPPEPKKLLGGLSIGSVMRAGFGLATAR